MCELLMKEALAHDASQRDTLFVRTEIYKLKQIFNR
jgi:hypothetical protein